MNDNTKQAPEEQKANLLWSEKNLKKLADKETDPELKRLFLTASRLAKNRAAKL